MQQMLGGITKVEDFNIFIKNMFENKNNCESPLI